MHVLSGWLGGVTELSLGKSAASLDFTLCVAVLRENLRPQLCFLGRVLHSGGANPAAWHGELQVSGVQNGAGGARLKGFAKRWEKVGKFPGNVHDMVRGSCQFPTSGMVSLSRRTNHGTAKTDGISSLKYFGL